MNRIAESRPVDPKLLLLGRRLLWRCRPARSCWLSRRSAGRFRQSSEVDLGDLDRIVRAIVSRVGSLSRDLLYQFHAFWRALAEEVVVPIQMRRRYLGDEEL